MWRRQMAGLRVVSNIHMSNDAVLRSVVLFLPIYWTHRRQIRLLEQWGMGLRVPNYELSGRKFDPRNAKRSDRRHRRPKGDERSEESISPGAPLNE